MPDETSLIATIVAGLTIAFVLGALAQRVKVSPLAGYLLAGVAIGPYTPGFVADLDLAFQLAEIGVRRVSIGGGLSRVAFNAMMGAAREMKEGNFGFVRDMIGIKEVGDAFKD